MTPDGEPILQVEDESYFASMTDLMVGMLFIFVIMLMAFALNLKTQQQTFEDTSEQLARANETRRQMLEEIKHQLLQTGVKVEIDTLNGVLRLPEKLPFARGEFRLSDSGLEALTKLATVLSDVLPCYAMSLSRRAVSCPVSKGGRLEAVFIEGHTDDVPIFGRMASRIGDNWQLSTARAIETYRELVRSSELLAVINNDSRQRLLGVSGYGENRPLVSNDSEEARALNRRIDLRFLMATPNEADLRRIRREVEQGINAP
jgi:flagellar motor protein MotB